jgi:hypothetical protein
MSHESMFQLLEGIEKRPEMYVGGSDQERDEQLRQLDWVLFGYQLALIERCPGSKGNFLMDFARFLMESYGCSAARGPVAAVRDLAPKPEDAWNLFWKSVHDFREQRRGSTADDKEPQRP